MMATCFPVQPANSRQLCTPEPGSVTAGTVMLTVMEESSSHVALTVTDDDPHFNTVSAEQKEVRRLFCAFVLLQCYG